MIRRCNPTLLWALLALMTDVPLCSPHPVPTNPGFYEERTARGWCGPQREGGEALPGMDDRDCRKRVPPLFERAFTCPVSFASVDRSLFSAPTSNVSEVGFDTEELTELKLPPGAKAAVIIVRRLRDGTGYVVRHLGRNSSEPIEPWSSSKVLAASHAGFRLRGVSDRLSLEAWEGGRRHRELSDLLTIVASYDTTQNYTSNSIGGYYQAIGGHQDADDFVHNVIGAPMGESFGGNYGERPPPGLGYNFTSDSHVYIADAIWPDPTPSPPISNSMSHATMAHWLRRIVMAREDAQGKREEAHGQEGEERVPFPWGDSESILYGAEESEMFPGLQWGGMSMSSDVYLQSSLNMTSMDHQAQGLWRIFSKFGFGLSSIRNRYEVVLNGYMCLPRLADGSGAGLEAFISASVPDYSHDNGANADAKMQAVSSALVEHLLHRYY